MVRDALLGGQLARERPRLRTLDEAGLHRHRQVAVQARGHGARTQKRLVDVHDLGLAEAANGAVDEAEGELTGALRD